MNIKRLWILLWLAGVALPASEDLHAADSADPIRQAPRVLSAHERNIGRLIPDLEFQDLAGGRHHLSELVKEHGLLVAVTSTSCPLSRKYLPTLIEDAKKYSTAGFGVLLVNPIATDKDDAMQAAAASLGECGIYACDDEGDFVRALQLTSTTDALLIDPARTVRYHGAIDDQFGFGYANAAPRKTYLATAIDEYLHGLPIAITATEAPGCHLDEAPSSASSGPVTYHNRISRIVQFHCAECHREGGVAPFSLESHDDVVAHAAMIETVVQRGTMPPWFAAPAPEGAPSPWVNDCSLAPDDKADLLAWLQGDRAVGDPQDAPLPPHFPTGWTIGEPDLIASFPEAIPVQATGVMKYQHMEVDLDLDEDKWVERIEIRPGVPEVVHHALVFVRPPRDSEEGEQRRSSDDGITYWGIYVPGNSKAVYPQGFARKLPKGSRLHFQMHYTPNGTATEDLTQIGFIFADQEPKHEVLTATLANSWFEIPPGDAHYTDFTKIRLPEDVTVLGFLPHMHLRGKACSYEVITPDGEPELLLDVPRYDFNWQLLYRLAQPRTFKAGAVLKFNATFDNSEANPANPDPTIPVRWGEQTYDEMIVGYIEYYVPAGAEDGGHTSLTGDRDQLLFTTLDDDNNGRLSPDEFRKLGAHSRLKFLDAETIDSIHASLDEDQDGALMVDEFRNLRDLFRKKR